MHEHFAEAAVIIQARQCRLRVILDPEAEFDLGTRETSE